MLRNSILLKVIAALFALSTASAFSPRQQPTTTPKSNDLVEKMSKFAMTASIAIATSPLVAFAIEEVDDYEYGAVSAPIGVAWAGGVLAVGTALLPIALQGGEEAFEEMKSQDKNTFGKTGNGSVLDRKRKGRF